ncbi:MAG: aminodeoxychorismate/anthranilate synthase component II [Sandaracinus sp.]
MRAVAGRAAVLVIDNYDSFTFNLVQLVRAIALRERAREDAVVVVRNDVASAGALLAEDPGGVLLSPGPGLPRDAGVCLALVRAAPETLPLFGVCLGMQILAEALGGEVVRAPRTMHGRTSVLRHDARGAFADVPSGARVMRYHSWVVEEASLPPGLEASAWSTDDGALMAMRHRTRPLEAVQFHPESFLTEHGDAMLGPFVKRSLARARA